MRSCRTPDSLRDRLILLHQVIEYKKSGHRSILVYADHFEFFRIYTFIMLYDSICKFKYRRCRAVVFCKCKNPGIIELCSKRANDMYICTVEGVYALVIISHAKE